MKSSLWDRFTLLSYLLTISKLVAIVGIAARDVLFERFTVRIGRAAGLEFDFSGSAAAGTADGLVIMGGTTSHGYSE